MAMEKIKSFWANLPQDKQRLISVAGVVVIAGLVGSIIIQSRAAVSSVVIEAESGVLSGNASEVDGTGASGQAAVRFAGGGNPNPNPPNPNPTGGCTATPTSGTSVSAGSLSDAVSGASGGQTFLVTGSGSLSVSGKNFTSPVVIKAASRLGATLTNVQITNSSNITLEGFKFGPNTQSTLVKIASSNNIKILRNSFDHKDVTVNQSTIVTAGTSSKIEIGCNEFKDKNRGDNGGTKITGSYIKTQYDGGDAMTKEMHIHHNHFKNINYFMTGGVPAGDSDREAIAMGIADSQSIVTNNLVEYNLFEDCDGENEIITVKTSKNIFRNNTFKNSYGSLSIRFGADTIVEGNYFYGTGAGASPTDPNYQTGGIRTYGTKHILKNNFMKDLTGDSWRLPILVDSGDTSNSTGGDGHQTSTNLQVTGNTILNSNGGIHIGSANYGNKPSGNTVSGNTVSSSKGILFNDVATGGTWSGNKAHATGAATAVGGTAKSAAEVQLLSSAPSVSEPAPLAAANVGPNAP
jgi:hypothetical protein